MGASASDTAVFGNFGGSGELSRLIAEVDWGVSPVGPMAGWPQSLKTAVGLMLPAEAQIVLFWGPEYVAFYNAAYAPTIGDKHPRALGRPAVENWTELWDDLEPLLRGVRETGKTFVAKDRPFYIERHGYGETVYFDVSYSAVPEVDGSVGGVLCIVSETTERVLAEAKLRLSEERLRLAVENAEIGFWDVEEGFGTLTWPPRTKAMFGISPDAPVTMDDFFNGLHPEDRERVGDVYAAAADPSRRSLYDVEYRTVGKEDGIVRWVAAKGRGVFDRDGPAARCIRVIGTAIDITSRKAAEAELLHLNQTLEQRVSTALAERRILVDIVEGTDAFVQVVDLDFHWLAINRAAVMEFERIFGVRPRVGDSMLDVLAHLPEHQAAVRAVWARALTGEEFTETQEFGESSLDRRYYEMKFNVLRDADGRRIGAYQFVYDVTERLRDQERLAEAEEALRQSQKMEAMGKLTGGVAHDFNNLLVPIIGGLDMLQRRGGLDGRSQRILGGALQSAERAKTLVQRLLAFARRQPLQSTAVDLRALVEDMADLVASTTGPQVEVVVSLPEDLPAVHADANQLEMALLNLAVNARDAMPDGGRLRIAATAETVTKGGRRDLPPGDYVRLSVSDTGVGMDVTTLARAVEPFFSTKGVGRGTGLGLSMVHGLASQLGGQLTISSQLGLGTNIELWLRKAVGDADPRARTESAPQRSLSAGTILLVDDEDLVRGSTAEMLGDLGYAVVEAASADEATKLLGSGMLPDMLITDHLMPGVSGTELARRVRAAIPNVQVLVISGYAEVEDLAPDLPRLTKPFKQADLIAALANLEKAH